MIVVCPILSVVHAAIAGIIAYNNAFPFGEIGDVEEMDHGIPTANVVFPNIGDVVVAMSTIAMETNVVPQNEEDLAVATVIGTHVLDNVFLIVITEIVLREAIGIRNVDHVLT